METTKSSIAQHEVDSRNALPGSDLNVQLREIGLRALPTSLDDFLARAAAERWSPQILLEQLAQVEANELIRRRLERRLRVSGIKFFKPMTAFDWNWPSKIERDVIENALTLDFLREARNLVLMGSNGLGKTMIVQNICHAAMVAGISVLFRTPTALVEELRRQNSEGRRHKLRSYANVGLLCIDEVGYLSSDAETAEMLCEVISRRHERKPVIVTTNRAFGDWNSIFPNATSVPTLLDRLLHHVDTIAIEGRSYREQESARESAARQTADAGRPRTCRGRVAAQPPEEHE